MPSSAVSIVKGANPDELVERALDLLGGRDRSDHPTRSTFGIKPNAGHMGGPRSSVNTTPAVVAAIIGDCLQGLAGKTTKELGRRLQVTDPSSTLKVRKKLLREV